MEELLTIKEAAVWLKMSPWTIRRWVYAREIGVVRLGRSVRVPMAELVRKIEAGTTKADDDRA